MDEDTIQLAKLPRLDDRMIYHTKRLNSIIYASGTDGVAAYKAKYPEARSILIFGRSLAARAKPAGYTDSLCQLVEMWFTSDIALYQTNRADVRRLNTRLETTRFDPDKHFSSALSARRLAKLACVFEKQSAYFDTGSIHTMSQVRAAVKAAKAKGAIGRPFGRYGHISGRQLVIGDKSFTIQEHNGRDCLRVSVNGARIWQRLDILKAVLDMLGGEPSPLYSSIYRIGELDPDAKNHKQTAEQIAEPGELDPDPLGELDPAPQPVLADGSNPWATSLGERLAALRGLPTDEHPIPATAADDGIDPLSF